MPTCMPGVLPHVQDGPLQWEWLNADTIVLSAIDSEGAKVRGRCVLKRVGDNRVLEIDEVVPFERRWEEVGLRCELEAQGRIAP